MSLLANLAKPIAYGRRASYNKGVTSQRWHQPEWAGFFFFRGEFEAATESDVQHRAS
jgi:hypothetical protein